MTTASASGKIILFGEHAVVYGRPAIAVPVSDVRAIVEVSTSADRSGVWIEARDLGRRYRLGTAYDDDTSEPLQFTVRNVLTHLGISPADAALCLTIRSEIPIASGMGSGTGVATALVRALATHYGRFLASRAISDLVFRTEEMLHGRPSGIDNTVVAFEQPVFYLRDRCADLLRVQSPFWLVIGDTGVPSRTRDTVDQVRRAWSADVDSYEATFDRIGDLVDQARSAMSVGESPQLGRLMDLNQELLQSLGVSSPELDLLVSAARDAGALGAKLSGGGGGGCMIALVEEEDQEAVGMALLLAGAKRVYSTTVR